MSNQWELLEEVKGFRSFRFRQTNMVNFSKGNLIVETKCSTNVMHKQKKNCVELILNMMNERP